MTLGMHKKIKVSRNWRHGRNDTYFNDNRYFPLLEKRFYYYNKIKRAIAEEKAAIGYYQSGPKDGGGSSNHAFISDPTSRLAMKHMAIIPAVVFDADTPEEDTVERPEDWVFVVDQTFRYFDNEELVKQVLSRRYLHNESMPHSCIDLEIGEGQYYRARNAGLRYARECAIQIGLINAFEPVRNIEPLRNPPYRTNY